MRTHSAFIADLLDIKGYHEQGSVFLELFYEQLKEKIEIKKRNKIPTKKARVYVEEYIGEISGDEGGRIDIVIKDHINQLVIENKINARDQYKQLVRYNNRYPDALLLYLTLQNQDVSDDSITKKDGNRLKKNEDYFNITYKDDITKWLLRCKEKAASHPILRETLTQYINLIKSLTGQTMYEKMENEISQLIKAGYTSAKLIANNITKTERDIIYETIELIYKKLQSELNDKNWDITLDNLDKDWSGISVWNKKWNKYIRVKLEGQPKIYSNKNSVFGIIGNKNEIDRNKYKKLLTDLINDYYLKKSSDGWIAYKEISIFKDSIELFFDENKRKEIIDNYVKDFVNLSNSINDIIANQDV